MALIFVDGCDAYTATDGSDVGQKYDTAFPAEFNWSASAGRFGGGAIVGIDDQLLLTKVFPATGTTVSTDELFFSLSMLISAADAGENLLSFRSTSNDVNISVSILAGGFLRVHRGLGGTTLATSSQAVPLGTYFRLEMRMVISDTIGIVEMKFNEATVVSITNADTNVGDANINSVEIRGIDFGTVTYDDIVIHNSAGDAPTGFLGDISIDTIYPNAAGDVSDWTPLASTNVSNVDETGSNDGDTTYVESSTVNNKDLYNMDAMGSTDTIYGVAVNLATRATLVGSHDVDVLVKTASGEIAKSGSIAPDAAYKNVQGVFGLRPGGGAWTKTDVDAMQAGMELQS